MAKKTSKKTIKKAHRIARAIGSGGKVRNPFAVGMAAAKKAAKKGRRKR